MVNATNAKGGKVIGDKEKERPCKGCGIMVYFAKWGKGFIAINSGDDKAHVCF